MSDTLEQPDVHSVCLGAVVGAHGLSGEVRIKSFTQHPENIAAYGPLFDEDTERSFELVNVRQRGNIVIARVAGINDRNSAQNIVGARLFVKRNALETLPNNEFYHIDLVGLRAERECGRPFGRVNAVRNFGTGDILEITRESNETVMVPFTSDIVPKVDIQGGCLVVALPFDAIEKDTG
tara:strand:+ start:140 stop:679 length:540 start_codon:yes stop_codon:yes gene_type:complete